MLISIADVLPAATLDAMRETLDDPGLFQQGDRTAAGRARAVKHNLQLRQDSPAERGIVEKVKQALLDNPVFTSAARPKSFARVLVSRYARGMHYGPHVDAALIEGVRTDLSFTLFLSAPGEYEGGALIVETAGAEEPVKLPAGALALYPSNTIHRVEPVTSGVRLAAVGWVRSFIRSAEQRDILFNLDVALTDLADLLKDDPRFVQLANIRNNLIRMWAED